MKALRRWLGAALRALASTVSDLDTTDRLVVLGVAALHVAVIGWGLPASDGWDVDGVAPRDFLPGIAETYTPGRYHTYPPLHLELLGLLTLPITLVQAARAPSLAPADLVTTFTSVPTMTAFALVARLTSFVMSLGIVLMIGRMAAAIFDAPRARTWAMAVAGVEVAGTYYAHTTNLDIPALFWAMASLSVLLGALKDDDPKRLRRVGVLAALAIATKDQAYAVFAVSMPGVLLAWIGVATPRTRGALVREALVCLSIVVLVVLVLDGALFNPSGFRARIGFLTGPASQDFAQHSNDWSGRLSAFEDAVLFFPNHYPVALAPFLGAGLVLAVGRAAGRGRIAALVPLLGALSFTLAFNCVARRVEERFMLPQMQLVAVYAGGIGAIVARVASRGRRPHAMLVALGGAACVALGLRLSLCVIFTMAGDARYGAERWIAERVRPGERVEVYGRNVYLPRFPDGMRVERVDPRPVRGRGPMPGIVERQDRLGAVEERRPQWIVVGMGYAWRYLQEMRPPSDGRVLPPIQQAGLSDDDTREYIRALFAERTAYRNAYVAHYTGSALFPPRPMHASLATDVFVFERR